MFLAPSALRSLKISHPQKNSAGKPNLKIRDTFHFTYIPFKSQRKLMCRFFCRPLVEYMIALHGFENMRCNKIKARPVGGSKSTLAAIDMDCYHITHNTMELAPPTANLTQRLQSIRPTTSVLKKQFHTACYSF